MNPWSIVLEYLPVLHPRTIIFHIDVLLMSLLRFKTEKHDNTVRTQKLPAKKKTVHKSASSSACVVALNQNKYVQPRH